MKPQVSEDSRFGRLVLSDGTVHEGNWMLVRGDGALNPTVFAYEGDTGCVVPLSSVAMLVPGGSLTPQELAKHDRVHISDILKERDGLPDDPERPNSEA